jgi:glycogen synthase
VARRAYTVLRIAFISHEYAAVANSGGIGTYVRNAARMLADRGHDVEVFCAGDGSATRAVSDVRVTQIDAGRDGFRDAVRQPFAARHRERPFDVVEGPEYRADAAGVRRDWPYLPLVVRLHTPTSIIDSINQSYVSTGQKLRFMAGGLRRGSLPRRFWKPDPAASDIEREHTLGADLIVGPSRAIIDELATDWRLPASRTMVVPNVFAAPPALLSLPPAPAARTILFLGKLEVRKGVIELARAVPKVVRAVPDARFIIVGRSLPMPAGGPTMKDVMMAAYGAAAANVEHVDAVPYEAVPALVGRASIAVFPSVWENFPNVCLEAMAAARAVIGSSAGGMAEMIEHGCTGLLVPPRDPDAIANAIIKLLKAPALVEAMGQAARAHVQDAYGPERIGPLHESSFVQAINR